MTILELMSKDLNLDIDFIKSIANKNNLYKKFKIKKRNGKDRIIYHPSKELKLLQYWLVRNIFSKFPISKYSTAFSKGNSIKKNALIHRNSNYILHMDIKNFFESIKYFHIDSLLDKISEIDNEDRNLIKNIVLYEGENLVVGSVSAPIIANCLMYEIDLDIYNTCVKDRDLIYTRYADDIIISSKNYIDKNIVDDIKLLLEKRQFEINDKKTFFMNRKGRRTITGITIDNNNNNLSLGSKRYKKIKNMIYKYLLKNEGNKEILLGYLAYIKDIDENKYKKIKENYKVYDKNNELFKA